MKYDVRTFVKSRALLAALMGMMALSEHVSAELLALYRFEDGSADLGAVIADSSINGFDGEVAGDAIEFVPGRDGFGNAARFTTANGFVTAAFPVGTIVGDFAISFWMKPESLSGSSAYVTARNVGGSQLAAIWEYLDDHVELFFTGGTGPNPRPGSGIAFADTEWRHIVYTRSGTEYAYYLNGVKTEIGTLAGNFNNVAQNLFIGAANASGASGFSGLLDDVAWFSQGLDEDQVEAIMAGDFSGFIPDPALLAPAVVDFGTVLLSESPFALSFDVTNIGESLPLDITGLDFTGPDAVAFAAGALPTGIAPGGGTGTVNFTFTPDIGAAVYMTTAILTSNDPRSEREVDIVVTVEESPRVGAPALVQFPPIRTNEGPGVREFEVRNLGGAAVLEISEVTFSGTNGANFTITSFPTSLQPGETGMIVVTFDPDGVAGSYSADCEITSNDDLSPTLVQLEIFAADVPVAANAYQQAVLNTGPLLYWTFDEDDPDADAVDVIWGLPANDLRRQGAAGRVTSPLGLGNAADFDGVSGSRFFTDTLELGATSFPHYAIEMWIRLEDPTSLAYLLEGWNGTPGGTNSPALIHGFNPNLEAFFQGGFRTGSAGPTTLADMGWHHVVMEVNVLDNTHSFYINGALAGTYPGSVPWRLPALAIGSPAVNTDEPMVGQIDELAFYDLDGGAITGQDIADHYLALGDGAGQMPQLVVESFDAATSELRVELRQVPPGKMFHLRGSTDLEEFTPLSPPVHFDSDTPSPLVIQTGGQPRFFLKAFEGESP